MEYASEVSANLLGCRFLTVEQMFCIMGREMDLTPAPLLKERGVLISCPGRVKSCEIRGVCKIARSKDANLLKIGLGLA